MKENHMKARTRVLGVEILFDQDTKKIEINLPSGWTLKVAGETQPLLRRQILLEGVADE